MKFGAHTTYGEQDETTHAGKVANSCNWAWQHPQDSWNKGVKTDYTASYTMWPEHTTMDLETEVSASERNSTKEYWLKHNMTSADDKVHLPTKAMTDELPLWTTSVWWTVKDKVWHPGFHINVGVAWDMTESTWKSHYTWSRNWKSFQDTGKECFRSNHQTYQRDVFRQGHTSQEDHVKLAEKAPSPPNGYHDLATQESMEKTNQVLENTEHEAVGEHWDSPDSAKKTVQEQKTIDIVGED